MGGGRCPPCARRAWVSFPRFASLHWSSGMGLISTVDKVMHNPVPIARVDDILRPAADNPIMQRGFGVTSLDALLNWARTGSMWPMTFGLACCAVEMMHAGASRLDLDRYGVIFR